MAPGGVYLGNENLVKPGSHRGKGNLVEPSRLPTGAHLADLEAMMKHEEEFEAKFGRSARADVADLEASKKPEEDQCWLAVGHEQATSNWREMNAASKRAAAEDYNQFKYHAPTPPNSPKLPRTSCHLWVDVELVLAWIVTCERHHGDHCQTLSTGTLDLSCRTLRLIDVCKGNLERAKRSDRYLALSYVWGEIATSLMASKDNIDLLQSDGISKNEAFSRRIPRTIKDAMEFTKITGETYLWVDRLCIVQDDSAAKQAQINNMAAFYTNAYLTLIATILSNSPHRIQSTSGNWPPLLRCIH